MKIYYKNLDEVKQLLEELKKYKMRNGYLTIKTDKDKNFVLVGTGAQIADFFSMFGIIDKKVFRKSKYFKLYKLARCIFNFFMSEKQSRTNIERSKLLIRNFLKLYYELFVDTNIETCTPKMHELIHLPKLTKKFGNLAEADTKKYERFHQTHINSDSSSKNSINLEYSILKNYLESVDFDVEEDDVDCSDKQLTNGQLSFLKRKYSFFIGDRPFKIVKKATIRKIEFKKDKVFVHRESGPNGPIFAKVEMMFSQDGNLIIVAKKFDTLSFNEDSFVYAVTQTDDLISFNYSEMDCFKALYFFENLNCIKKNFHLPNEPLVTDF